MTDDIVTRLREQAVCTRSECDDCDLHRNAADEIERLRSDMKELLEITKLFADEGTCRWKEDDLVSCPDVHHTNCEWHEAEHMWESFCMSRGI